jgi:uncharacterized protein YecT (DUF1311 family)
MEMKKLLIFIIGYIVCVSSFADWTAEGEISKRSGLPSKEVKELTSDCNNHHKTNQEVYFCAWHDFVVAERNAQIIIDKEVDKSPKRRARLEVKMKHWKEKSYKDCLRYAHKHYGGGAEEPMVAEMCKAADMQDKVDKMKKQVKSGQKLII